MLESYIKCYEPIFAIVREYYRNLRYKGIIQMHNGPDPEFRACVHECKHSIQDNAPCAFLTDRL